MASLLRFARQTGRALQLQPTFRTKFIQQSCFISTSKKNKDSATIAEQVDSSPKVEEYLTDKDENWMSFGYSLTDRNFDEWSHHMIMFFTVTIAMCCSGFYFAFAPKDIDRSWVQREAYLTLESREAQGLPLVDRNLVDPDRVVLPSDEELGDMEIII